MAGGFPGGPGAETPNTGSLGSIPDQGTRPHMLQLRHGAAREVKKKGTWFTKPISILDELRGLNHTMKGCFAKLSCPAHILNHLLHQIFIFS